MAAGGSWTNQVQFLVIVAGGGIAGVYVYDPTPGAGNLIASLTDSATDPFSNATKAGVTATPIFGGHKYAVNLNLLSGLGNPGLSIQDLVSAPNSASGVFGAADGTATATAVLYSGTVTAGDQYAVVVASSQTTTGITNGLANLVAGEVRLGATPTLTVDDNAGTATMHQALLAAPSSPGNGYSHYANAVSYPAVITTSGVTGRLPVRQTDLATHAAGNDANPHNITKAWTIPAGDTLAGTVIDLTTHVTVNTGQTTIETLTLGINLDGTQTALATLGTAFNGGALNTSYDIPVTLSVVVDANGADTPQVCLNGGGLGDLSANRLSTNSANMPGHANGLAFAKASSHTVAVYAQWGGAGGSAQSAQAVWSKLTY